MAYTLKDENIVNFISSLKQRTRVKKVLKQRYTSSFKRDYHCYPLYLLDDNKDVNSRKTITKERREKFSIFSFIILNAQIKFHLSTNFVEVTPLKYHKCMCSLSGLLLPAASISNNNSLMA